MKLTVRFLNIAIKAAETNPRCFCIDGGFIFGFHVHDCVQGNS